MQANGGVLTFFSLYDTLTKDFHDRGTWHVGIKNDAGEIVLPSAMTFESETYPLLKKVTIGLVKDDTALEAT